MTLSSFLLDLLDGPPRRASARRRPTATGPGRLYGLALLVLALLLASAMPSAAQTVVRTVGFGDSCDFGDLQAAVDAISVLPAQERIVRIERGLYQNVAIVADEGPLTLRGGFESCDSTAPTPGAKSVLEGTGNQPVVRVGTITVLVEGRSLGASETYVLDNLELSGGHRGLSATGPVKVVVEDSLIIGNEAFRGGGVFVDGSFGRAELDLVRTAINGNQTVTSGSIRPDGGGIYCRGDGLIRGLEGNGMVFNETDVEGRGGAIYLDGCDLEAQGRFSIQLNRAHRGGGIATSGDADILLASNPEGEVVFALNRAREDGAASGKGGAFYLEPGADLRVVAARIEDNRALPEFGSSGGQGGAIFSHGARVEMFRETGASCQEPCLFVSGNRAARGAALFATRGALTTVRHTTFDGNVTEGAVLEIGSDNAGPTSLDLRHSVLTRNVAEVLIDLFDLYSFTGRHISIAGNLGLDTAIVARNHPGGSPPSFDLRSSILFEPLVDLVDVFDGVTPFFDCLVVSDDRGLAGARILEMDPLLVDAIDGDLHLEPTSPAIDICPDLGGRDIDFQPVPVDQEVVPDDGTPADAGADEVSFLEPPMFADGFESGDLSAWSASP